MLKFLAYMQFRQGRPRYDVQPRLLNDSSERMKWDEQPTPDYGAQYLDIKAGLDASSGFAVRRDVCWERVEDLLKHLREVGVARPADLGSDWTLVPPPSKVHCQVVYMLCTCCTLLLFH